MLSAKGSDVTTWRAVEDFTAAFRQTLLDRAVSDRSDGAEAVFMEASASLDSSIVTHRKISNHLNSLLEEVAAATPATNLRELSVAFYSELYRHFSIFCSAPAFYQLSMAFLRQASSTVIANATEQLGLSAGDLPEMALIAVGPTGRCEYSPFYLLQILLVHGEVPASQLPTLDLLCHAIHAGFEDAGLPVDPVVTPRNLRWRGTLAEWRQRFEDGLQPLTDKKLIDLYRLIDQYPLHQAEGFARELKQISGTVLSGNRTALANLIVRMSSLSNGLGIMGRLKLERSGSERGLFRLVDHGLLPFSAALSALVLIKESTAVSNCERIRDLLKQGELNVDLSERMLATWYVLHNLRLQREQSFQVGEHKRSSFFLNPAELTDDQRQSLKTALESVAIIQRHVAITFSGTGE